MFIVIININFKETKVTNAITYLESLTNSMDFFYHLLSLCKC